jgi:predicted deacylase
MRTGFKRAVLAIVILVLLGLSIYVYVDSRRPVPVIPLPQETGLPVHEVIGRSVEGRSIDAYTYGTGTTSLVFVGGIHGGYEWNSVLLAYAFMDHLEANPAEIPLTLQVTVIPSANPDAVYAVVGKEGRFMSRDVSTSTLVLESARFNANNVDLNRNFDCLWQATSTWRSRQVSAGTSAFSEPETRAIRDFILRKAPAGAVFWHSQSNAVYASQCGKGILPGTLTLMNTYASASGYPAVKTFDAYVTTGAADDWLAKVGVSAVTVELKTHEAIEWDRNLLGIRALLEQYR